MIYLDSSYLQVCKLLNRIAFVLFGTSVVFALTVLRSSTQNSDAIVPFFIIVWVCWTPLITFILVNRQLIISDNLHL